MTRNRREQLLRSVPQHSRPLIVVDNGSTDGSVEALRSRHPEVNVIALDRNVAAVARNIGVRAATTPYVAFADDDSWWVPGSLEQAAAVLDGHPDVALLTGAVLIGDDGVLDPFTSALEGSPLPGRDDGAGVPVLGFMACAAVVRRSAFLEVGGFDRVVEFVGEEERLALDLADHGWQLRYLPDLLIRHLPEPGDRPAGARRRRVARNDVLTAAMRLPVSFTARRVLRHAAAGRDGRLGVLLAVPRLPLALRHRRPIGRPVQDAVRLLESGRTARPGGA